MFAKSIVGFALFAMFIGSHQQVVVPAYSAAYYPSAYYTSPLAAYSPYSYAAAYPTVWAWGSNKNKNGGAAGAGAGAEGEAQSRTFARSTILNNQPIQNQN